MFQFSAIAKQAWISNFDFGSVNILNMSIGHQNTHEIERCHDADVFILQTKNGGLI